MSILPTHADPTPGTHNWQHTTLSVYCTQCTTMQANVSHHPHSRTITSRSTRPPHKHHPKPFTSSAAQTRLRRPLHTARRAADPEQPSGDTTPSTSSSTGSQPDLLDPSSTIVWGGRLPSTRRAAVGGAVATAIALGGNLGGITSWLLSLDGGQLAAALRADIVVPVNGFKRCYDAGYGFEFLYPSYWLADQTLFFRAAQRAEAARSLDPPALRKGPRARQVVEPSAAFGPPGSSGEENISIIVAPIFEGFRLDSLGSPQAAAQQFLDTIAAPQGSDKTAALVAAEQRRDVNGLLYYQFEFTIETAKWKRHNVAVLATQDNLLYTLTVQCPQSRWDKDGAVLKQAAASLKLKPSSNRQYPGAI